MYAHGVYFPAVELGGFAPACSQYFAFIYMCTCLCNIYNNISAVAYTCMYMYMFICTVVYMYLHLCNM